MTEKAKNEFNLNVYLTFDGKSDSAVKVISAGIRDLIETLSSIKPKPVEIPEVLTTKEKPALKLDRESILRRGLDIYLKDVLKDFFTEVEISDISEMLVALRYRRAGNSVPMELCRIISRKNRIVSFSQPSNEFKKDEIGILFNNLSPYAHLSRRDASIVIKRSFPVMFSNTMPDTINSTLTKFKNVTPGRNRRTLNISVLKQDTARDLEDYLYELALMKQ